MSRDGKMALRGLRQLAFSEQLTDNASGSTYDNPILAEGPQVLSYTENFATDELPGGDEIVDYYQKLISADLTINVAKMHLSLLAMLKGSAAVVQSGSTPDEIATYERKTTDQAPYVSIDGLVAYLGSDEAGGGFLTTFWKAKLASHAVNHSQDGYANVTMTFKALARVYDKKVYRLRQYETSPVLTETPDVTAPTFTSVPADNATGVTVSSDIVVTWSEAIQFNAGDYTLAKVSDDSIVATSVTVNGTGQVVTINPNSNLSSSSEYYLVISANVKDVAGNPVASAANVSFTTA